MNWKFVKSTVVLAFMSPPAVFGQAMPTATRNLQISGFSGMTATHMGAFSGGNVGVTAGVDLGFRSVYSLYPSLEVRGTYPLNNGQVDSEKNVLGGLKLAKVYGRFNPYADLLFGRGQINYGAGYATPSGQFYYVQSVSNVISPGAGLDLHMTNQFSLKADGQFQRYSSPVSDSGHAFSTALTLGIVYRFGFRRQIR